MFRIRKTSALLLFSFLLSLNASAQNGYGTGNGGDGVLISGKPYLLDLVEFGVEKSPYFNAQITIKPGILDILNRNEGFKKFPNEKQKIALKLSELAAVSPNTAYWIATAFLFYSYPLVDLSLIDIQDEDTVLSPPRGTLVQLAVRQKSFISISKKHWQAMTVEHRAALLLHEVLYALQTPDSKGRQFSPDVRKLVGYLFSEEFENPSLSRLQSLSKTNEVYRMLTRPETDLNLERLKLTFGNDLGAHFLGDKFDVSYFCNDSDENFISSFPDSKRTLALSVSPAEIDSVCTALTQGQEAPGCSAGFFNWQNRLVLHLDLASYSAPGYLRVDPDFSHFATILRYRDYTQTYYEGSYYGPLPSLRVGTVGLDHALQLNSSLRSGSWIPFTANHTPQERLEICARRLTDWISKIQKITQ